MRDFETARTDLGLVPFLDSALGSLYLRPPSPDRPALVVRHLEGAQTGRAAALAGLLGAAQRWVEGHHEVARLLRVEQAVEVGVDFVARPHHVYYTSTRAYVRTNDPDADEEDDEDPPEPPPELDALRRAFAQAAGENATEMERLLVGVLARSVMDATGKTYFHEREGRFIAVDLSPRPDELDRWAELTPPEEAPA
jgi:hypothetical protein